MIRCNGYTKKNQKCKRMLKYECYCKQHIKYVNKYKANNIYPLIYRKINTSRILFIFKYFFLIWIINTILKKIIEIIFLFIMLYFIIYINLDYYFINLRKKAKYFYKLSSVEL